MRAFGGGRRLAFEFKATLAPELTRGGRAALELLEPERAFVVCPMADEGYDIAAALRVCGIDEVLDALT